MKNLNIEHLLNKHGLVLPTAPEPVGNYKAIIVSNNLAYISGQLPIINGTLRYKGKVGEDISIDEGYNAAKVCALNALSQINKLKTFKRILKVEGYINCKDDFLEHAFVLNGASDLFSSILGIHAGHTRSVIGCSSLPLGASVELVISVELNCLT